MYHARCHKLIRYTRLKTKCTVRAQTRMPVILFDLQNWVDNYLGWDPNCYNGTEYLILYADDVWLPDTVIYNRCAQYLGNSAIVAV